MSETPAARRWRKIVADHDASGLTIRAFAEARGLNRGTLAWWRSQLRKFDGDSDVPQTQFTALTVVEPVGTVVLALDDHKAHVVVDHLTDLGLLRRLLEAMA
jgi:transposase-like protein